MSNMVIQLLCKVTSHCPQQFVSSELGVPFAEALNFCLERLATEKGLKLKIEKAERFYFEPKSLLVNVISMYANMSHLEQFHKNVVADARSYSDEMLNKACAILNSNKKNIPVGAAEKEKFIELAKKLKG